MHPDLYMSGRTKVLYRPRNEPCVLPVVAQVVAECYAKHSPNLTLADVAAATTANAIRFFRLPLALGAHDTRVLVATNAANSSSGLDRKSSSLLSPPAKQAVSSPSSSSQELAPSSPTGQLASNGPVDFQQSNGVARNGSGRSAPRKRWVAKAT